MFQDDENVLVLEDRTCSSEFLTMEDGDSFDILFFGGVMDGDVLSKIDVISRLLSLTVFIYYGLSSVFDIITVHDFGFFEVHVQTHCTGCITELKEHLLEFSGRQR